MTSEANFPHLTPILSTPRGREGASAPRRPGPPPHEKGPVGLLDYDQVELDAAYDQPVYQPNIQQLRDRWASNSERTRGRIGDPLRRAYGPGEIEGLDIFRTGAAVPAPVFVFIHGGAWGAGLAKTLPGP